MMSLLFCIGAIWYGLIRGNVEMGALCMILCYLADIKSDLTQKK